MTRPDNPGLAQPLSVRDRGFQLFSLVRVASLAAVAQVLGMALTYVSGVLIARELGAELFGVFSLAVLLAGMAVTVAQLGCDRTVVRHVALYRSKGLDSDVHGVLAFSRFVSLGVGCLAGAILFVGSHKIANLFGTPELGWTVRLLAWGVPFLAWLGLSDAGLRGLQRPEQGIWLSQVFAPAVRLGLILVLASGMELGLPGVTWAVFLSWLVTALLCHAALGRHTRVSVAPGAAHFRTGEWLAFSLPLFIERLINSQVGGRLDTLLLGMFRDSATVGVYSAALRVAPIVIVPALGFNALFAPLVADFSGREMHKDLEDFFRVTTKWEFAVALPIAVLLIMLSDRVMLVFGQDFAQGAQALVILTLSFLVDASVGSVATLLVMRGHVRVSLANAIFLVICNLTLGLLLIPRFGLLGAAISSGVAVVLTNALRLTEVWLFHRLHPYHWDSLKPLLAIALALLSVFLAGLGGSGIFESVWVRSAVVIVLYSMFLVLLGLNAEERQVIRHVAQRLGNRSG